MATVQRLAIVGSGFIGNIHAFALKALRGGGLTTAEVVATCDVDEARAASLASVSGARLVSTDPAKAFESADAAWICTPTSSHAELIDLAAKTGIAVYCEKPLAPDLSTAQALAQTSIRSGAAHQVGLVLRFAPPLVTLKSLLAGEMPPVAGDPGSPLAAVLRDDQFFPIQGMYASTWRGDVKVAGGGTLIEHSIHDLDLLSWLLGTVTSVSARTANHAGHEGVEDVAVVTLNHASGAISSLVSVWHNLVSRPSTRRLEIFSERSLCTVEDEVAGPVKVEHPGGVTELGRPDRVQDILDRLDAPEALRVPLLPYALADLAFLRALSDGIPPAPGMEVALEAHRVVDAAYRSAALGGEPCTLA